MEVIEENKAGYKKTKIGWIPTDWELIKLEEVCHKIMVGIASSATHAYRENGIPLFRNQNIKEKGLDDSDLLFIDEKYEASHKNKRLKGGDILTVRTGYPGISCVVPDKYEGSQCFTSLITRPKKDLINSEWLSFYINSPVGKKLIISIEAGGAQKNVNSGSLQKILIPKITIEEQQKIASILSDWDTAIENTKILTEKLQLRKKGLIQQLLTGQTRLAGFTEEWKEKELGYSLQYTPRPKDKPLSPFLALGLRSHGKGVFHKPNFDPTSIAMETLYEVKKNDLVLNITFAWEHAIAIANEKDEGGLVSHRFPTYTFIDNISDALFFRYYVLQPRFKYLLGVISPGGAGRNRVMSKKDFPKLLVKVPSYEEQKAISNVLNSVDKEIKIHQTQLKQLKTQKKGLMQQLLTGKIRVN
jgi:type I restriction enzyme S subunit